MPYLNQKADDLSIQIITLRNQFDEGLLQLDKSIAQVRANKIDPATIKTDFEGKEMNLIEVRAALLAAKDKAIGELERARAEILKAADDVNGA